MNRNAESKRALTFAKLVTIVFIILIVVLCVFVRINPLVSKEEARVVQRLHQFAKSKDTQLPSAKLSDGAWDKVCVFDALSGLDPIYKIDHAPSLRAVFWNWLWYWDWSSLSSKTLGLAFLSPTRELLIVKVYPYGMRRLESGPEYYLNVDSKIDCYDHASTIVRKEVNDKTITFYFDRQENKDNQTTKQRN